MKRALNLTAGLLMAMMILSACSVNQFKQESSQEPAAAESAKEESVPEESSEPAGTIEESMVETSEESSESSVEPEEEQPELSKEITGGTSSSEAQELEPNVRYTGQYRGEEIWVSFTTGEEEEIPYQVTLENLRVGSPTIYAYMFDGEGTEKDATSLNYDRNWSTGANIGQADKNGRASTATFSDLLPKTTYYIQIKGGDKAEFSLRITDPTKDPFDVTEGRRTLSAEDEFTTATNQDEAPLLQFNTRYESRYIEGYNWICFTTGEKEDVPYQITLENLETGSDTLYAYLFDEYGTEKDATSLNYERNWSTGKNICQADQNGRASTGTIKDLLPNTT